MIELKDIIKPKTSNIDIKTCILPNKIKCVLIEDNNLDRSYVISSVNVGSLVDKQYYDGCAHLLEHLIFISSKKFSERNYLQKKVVEFGGSTNAYTDLTKTVYYLDVLNEHLEEILNIFVDFFYNAELNEKYIFDELKNVNSEHDKNIPNDVWRVEYIKHLIADKNSNYNIFATGSTETLKKPDISQKLKHLYNKYYIPENISICIASNKPMNEIFHLADKYFSQIKNKNKNINCEVVSFDQPFYKNVYGKSFFIKCLSKTKKIYYMFEFPSSTNPTIFNNFTYILNYNHNYSLNYYLINNGLALDCSSYHLDGVLNITAVLTDFGFNNIKKVNGIIKYTIDYILSLNWIDIRDYYQKIIYLDFNNSEKEDTLDLGIELVNNTHIYKLKNIYCGYEAKKSDINILKKYICFDNCIQLVISNEIGGGCDSDSNFSISPYYGTLYKEIPFINANNIHYNLKVDLNNQFIDIQPKFIQNLNNEIPILINNIWFGNTSKFNENVVYCKIAFYNENFFNTTKNYILTILSIDVLNYYLENNLYKVEDLMWYTSISSLSSLNQIYLILTLYNDVNFIQLYINTVLKLLTNEIKITDTFILSCINAYKKRLANITQKSSINYSYFICNFFHDNYYDYTTLLNELDNITPSMIRIYMKNLFCESKLLGKPNLIIHLYGNLHIKNIPSFNKINHLFNNNNNFIYPTFNCSKKNINIKHPNPKQKNNCINIIYHCGYFEPNKIIHLLLFSIATEQLFFTEMRTKQQLGYIVGIGYNSFYNGLNLNYYICQYIQSVKDCDYLENKINIFNNNTLKKFLNKIKLKNWIDTLKKQLEEKNNSTFDLFQKYNFEIFSRHLLFNRDELLLNEIKNITVKSFLNFSNTYFFNNNNKTVIKINGKNNKVLQQDK